MRGWMVSRSAPRCDPVSHVARSRPRGSVAWRLNQRPRRSRGASKVRGDRCRRIQFRNRQVCRSGRDDGWRGHPHAQRPSARRRQGTARCSRVFDAGRAGDAHRPLGRCHSEPVRRGAAHGWRTIRRRERGRAHSHVSRAPRSCRTHNRAARTRPHGVRHRRPRRCERRFLPKQRLRPSRRCLAACRQGMPPETYGQLIASADRHRVALDTSGAALLHGIQAAPLLIKPNRHEASQLLGHTIETLEQAVAAGRDLSARGPRIVVLSLGHDGALVHADRQSVGGPRAGGCRAKHRWRR